VGAYKFLSAFKEEASGGIRAATKVTHQDVESYGSACDSYDIRSSSGKSFRRSN
jgi:hypothetical protein